MGREVMPKMFAKHLWHVRAGEFGTSCIILEFSFLFLESFCGSFVIHGACEITRYCAAKPHIEQEKMNILLFFSDQGCNVSLILTNTI